MEKSYIASVRWHIRTTLLLHDVTLSLTWFLCFRSTFNGLQFNYNLWNYLRTGHRKWYTTEVVIFSLFVLTKKNMQLPNFDWCKRAIFFAHYLKSTKIIFWPALSSVSIDIHPSTLPCQCQSRAVKSDVIRLRERYFVSHDCPPFPRMLFRYFRNLLPPDSIRRARGTESNSASCVHKVIECGSVGFRVN